MTPQTRQSLNQAIASLGTVADREITENFNRTGAVIDFVKAHGGGYQACRVLDIGCSIGLHALAAINEGARVTGVDKYTFPEHTDENAFQLSKKEFEQVETVWRSKGMEVAFHDLAQPLPFADASFDLAVSNAVIEHLHGTHAQMLREAARVLKPGGFLVLTTPNLAYILKRIRFVFGRSPNWDIKDFFTSGKDFTGHTREFTAAECAQMVRMAGLTVTVATTRATYFRWKWFREPRKWTWILAYLIAHLSPRFGDHVFIAARKP